MNTTHIPLMSHSNSNDALGSRSEALGSGTCLATALAVNQGQDVEPF